MTDARGISSLLSKALRHTKMIAVHKYHVARYCWVAGFYKQALTHDMSKFSPTEFMESVRYYQGNRKHLLPVFFAKLLITC